MNSSLVAYRPRPRQAFIAREGYPFIGIALIAALLMWMTGWNSGGMALLLLASFVAYFFRNPKRTVPEGDGLVVAPADGRVVEIRSSVDAPHTGHPSTIVGIFMSVLDVHINRLPVSARVKKIVYHAGNFLVASLDKASEQNERNALILEDDQGREFVLVQVAGLIARRIVCYLRNGDQGRQGQRFGLIRFGSRVDIYMPLGTPIEVKKGDRVRAGESIIGRLV
jgi:phosphatidylserine decarboxylase